jgi:hypothetical protein
MRQGFTTLTVVIMSLIVAGGPLVAIAQETVVADNNDAQNESSSGTSLPAVPNNDQNSPVNQTGVLQSHDDAVDVTSGQITQLLTVAPEVDIENSTAIQISDLLEFYGLDTEGPVCPPCP